MMMGGPVSAGALSVTVTVKFEEDLPNGPYGEVNMMSATIYVPPKSTYQDVQTAILDAWKESRKGVAQISGRRYVYTEEWSVGTFKYKGGGVDLEKPAVEGSHNVEFKRDVQTERMCRCIVM
jgi:hypothetical protein